jgi:thiol-disulfide isomerase/thioredoxin
MSTKIFDANTAKDWRIKLFGDAILVNHQKNGQEQEAALEAASDVDVETGVVKALGDLTPVSEAFVESKYDYIALFFGANYCPFCKKFAPHVVAAAETFESKKCKVIFVSNDRDEENFNISCAKVRGLDVMQYDTSKTAQMRDLFGLKTIPALMILRNKDFEKEQPFVVSNAREILELDPELTKFPWPSKETTQAAPLTAWERLWIHGRHGKWWQLGHKNVSETHPNDMYMDEHSVRIRAGLLNIITWLAVMNIFAWRDQTLVKVIFGIVVWEFVTSMAFGLTPVAPLGWIATCMSIVLHDGPFWKPANPKRFAWAIGLTLATTCFILVQFRHDLGGAYKPTVAAIALTCNAATWLEGNAGFCVGCFLYNSFLVKYFKYEECSECKL